jgi:hypothetical protein
LLSRAKSALASLFGSSHQPDSQQVKIDVVTEHPETGVFAIILVETGPWAPGAEEAELRRIQGRLYACVDVAVDGHLAAKYPNSKGRPVRIQLDTYDIPEGLVRPFFDRFADHVTAWSEVQQAIQAKRNIESIMFEYNPRVIDGEGRSNHGAAQQGDEADER